VIAPAEDLGDGVRAGDEEQLGIRPCLLQLPKRVDRVGGSVAVDVDAADGERGLDAVAMTVIR
jgi:hypothetical protein